MARKYKAIKIAKEGNLTDEKDDPIICPIRNANCSINCAWFSVEGGVLRCQNAVIGAVGGKPVRSFHLHTGPLIYNLDESLIDYDLDNSSDNGQ
jgi:hypothetical protein